jgi:hypothetical protein
MGLDLTPQNQPKKNRYYRPTPKKWRQLGDGLLAFSMFVSGYAVIEEMKYVTLGSIAIGGIGKFLTNFFTED